MHQGGSLSLRTPDDVGRDEIAVDGRNRWYWSDGYLHVDRLSPEEVVTIHFPMKEHDERVRVQKDEYIVSWRGDTVMAIDPPGHIGPLYQRGSAHSKPVARNTQDPSYRSSVLPRASRIEW